MKIWTCASSPRSGSRNAWTRIKNVKVPIVWAIIGIFCTIQMISCRDWWPWTKPGYITMTWRQSDNQCSGGIAAYLDPKNSECKIRWKFLAWILWEQDSILLINYLRKGQTINASYYSSLLVQLEDILKGRRLGNTTNVVLFLHDNAPAHRTLETQKKQAYLGIQCLEHPPYSPDPSPSEYHLLTGLNKTIESSTFFVRRVGQCIRGDQFGRKIS